MQLLVYITIRRNYLGIWLYYARRVYLPLLHGFSILMVINYHYFCHPFSAHIGTVDVEFIFAEIYDWIRQRK